MPSAQVKSAVLLAGLQAQRRNRGDRTGLYTGSYGTGAGGVRRHASADRRAARIALEGGQRLDRRDAARARATSRRRRSSPWPRRRCRVRRDDRRRRARIPTRAALLDVLRRFGADVDADVDEDMATASRSGRIRDPPRRADAIS